MSNARWLPTGQVLRDPSGEVVVLVLNAAQRAGALRCDEVPMHPGPAVPCGANGAADRADGRLRTGARYRDDATGLELRCLRAGGGELTFDGRVLVTKGQLQDRGSRAG